MLFPQVKEMSEELQQEARRAEHVTNPNLWSDVGHVFKPRQPLSGFFFLVLRARGVWFDIELELDANHETPRTRRTRTQDSCRILTPNLNRGSIRLVT